MAQQTVNDVRALLRGGGRQSPPAAAPASEPEARGIKWIGRVGYDAMTVPEARRLIETLNAEQRAELLEYERANKSRINVINVLEPEPEVSE